MKSYSNQITLTNNSRGVYSLDPSFGCYNGLKTIKEGCYYDCYAARSAKIYGYDFTKTTIRDFKDNKHRLSIIKQINKSKLDFIRMGTNGDPSECWEHTIEVLNKIKNCNKHTVIVTKHWENLTLKQMSYLKELNVCINTSVSALDNTDVLSNSIEQYERLNQYCKSILRVVTASFNIENYYGSMFNEIQKQLLNKKNVIDTVLRIGESNPYVLAKIININKHKFLTSDVWASKLNNKTYFGNCFKCHEQCGINVKTNFVINKKLLKQQSLF